MYESTRVEVDCFETDLQVFILRELCFYFFGEARAGSAADGLRAGVILSENRVRFGDSYVKDEMSTGTFYLVVPIWEWWMDGLR